MKSTTTEFTLADNDHKKLNIHLWENYLLCRSSELVGWVELTTFQLPAISNSEFSPYTPCWCSPGGFPPIWRPLTSSLTLHCCFPRVPTVSPSCCFSTNLFARFFRASFLLRRHHLLFHSSVTRWWQPPPRGAEVGECEVSCNGRRLSGELGTWKPMAEMDGCILMKRCNI